VTVKVWYHVRDLEAARRFYAGTLGFGVEHVDEGWVELAHGEMRIGLAEGDPSEEGGVATIDVSDVKAEADRLRAQGVEVGVVLELHGQVRLLDVFDPEGNRIQLAQVLDDTV
jgi:catechol 2,3-dioxygenase-like lactoylglutathione lyase family enzyme